MREDTEIMKTKKLTYFFAYYKTPGKVELLISSDAKKNM